MQIVEVTDLGAGLSRVEVVQDVEAPWWAFWRGPREETERLTYYHANDKTLVFPWRDEWGFDVYHLSDPLGHGELDAMLSAYKFLRSLPSEAGE